MVGPDVQPLRGCNVGSFRAAQLNPETPKPVSEYKDRFSGLIGDDIPEGAYVASIVCEGRRIGDQSMAVEGPGQFELVSVTSRIMRSDPARPVLEIKLRHAPAGGIWWVRFTGVYRSEMYTERLTKTEGVARLTDPEPGVYLVAVHSTGGYACYAEIEFAEFTRHWEFDPESCSFQLDRYARVVQRDASHRAKPSRWAEEMRKDRDDLLKALERGADRNR